MRLGCVPLGVQQLAEPLRRDDARYEASFFGTFRTARNGRPLGEPAWRRNKAKLLLKWFLLHPGEPFSGEQLCRLFWPDLSRDRAANNLHVTLHYLRQLLEPELPPRRLSTFIQRNRHKDYWFNLADLWWTDVLEADALASRAEAAQRRGEMATAIALYTQVVAYYQLTFLPEDVYEDVFSNHRRHYDISHTRALSQLMHLYERASQLPNALSCALHLLSVDPYNASAAKTIVHVYLRQGNVPGAIRQLDDFLHIVGHHLGLAPDNDLLVLRRSILQAR
jgi:DNA-binding SARP family transcriptional activator